MSPLFFLTLRRRSALPEQSKVPLGQARFLRANFPDYSAVDVCQRLFSALMKVGQRLVVDAHEVEDGGVDVVDGRFVHHGLEAEVVGLPVSCRLSLRRPPSTCRPYGLWLRPGAPLPSPNGMRPTAAPHDERGVQQSALFEVG